MMIRITTQPLTALALAASLALMSGGSALAQPAQAGPNGPDGVAALRQVLADPYGPKPDILSTFSFNEAQYLIDGLTITERHKFSELLIYGSIGLPSGIETAIRAKAPRRTNTRD